MSKLVIVFTARMQSDRLPGKAMAMVKGKPLASWILKRLEAISPYVVVATTTDPADDALEDLANDEQYPCYRGPLDVVGRMQGALDMIRHKWGDPEYVLRGLGDCPFMDAKVVHRSMQVMDKLSAECFRWHLPPSCWPVYGAREFPYQLGAWRRIVKHTGVMQEGFEIIHPGALSPYREHVDHYFHEHVDEFRVAWHESPPRAYMRPYRLEVDWPEDLELIRAIASGPGMLAPLPEIINFLDNNPEVAALNRNRVEKTGPTVSYDYHVQRGWVKLMSGREVVGWDNLLWVPPSSKSMPCFCQSGECMLGFSEGGVLYTKWGKLRGSAYLDCQCGAGLVWREALPRGAQNLKSSFKEI